MCTPHHLTEKTQGRLTRRQQGNGFRSTRFPACRTGVIFCVLQASAKARTKHAASAESKSRAIGLGRDSPLKGKGNRENQTHPPPPRFALRASFSRFARIPLPFPLLAPATQANSPRALCSPSRSPANHKKLTLQATRFHDLERAKKTTRLVFTRHGDLKLNFFLCFFVHYPSLCFSTDQNLKQQSNAWRAL